MKNNYWMIFAVLVTTGVIAQPLTNAPLAAPAAAATNATPAAEAVVTNPPATKVNAPPPKVEKKRTEKKKADKKTDKKAAAKKKDPGAELKTVPLVAGKATVIASNVNVRGQAKLKSEVVTRLDKGQEVAVLEEVILKQSGADEPSAWAKIILPAKVHVWVNTTFIDSTNKTVIPKKLKLRAGAGEEYSVLGMLKKGDSVTIAGTKGAWTEIEAPAEACGFVAAQYLKQEPPGSEPPAPPEPPVTPATVADNTQIAAPPTEPPVVNANTNAPADTNAVPSTPEPPATEEPPPKRIVQREGIVRGTVSIQAPTHFALISPESGRTVDYLHTTSPNLDLSRYKGLHIIVTGEEGLDERWGNTPVINIQKIQVLE
jgi:hypothetical protein